LWEFVNNKKIILIIIDTSIMSFKELQKFVGKYFSFKLKNLFADNI